MCRMLRCLNEGLGQPVKAHCTNAGAPNVKVEDLFYAIIRCWIHALSCNLLSVSVTLFLINKQKLPKKKS